MSAPVVDVRKLCKSFGEHRVFDGLDLEIRRGETLTVLGASGSGKSVLLKMMLGLVEPDSGQVLIDGQDMVALAEQARAPLRRRLSMLFQGGALFDSLDVGHNVAYPLVRQSRFHPNEIMARVAEALALVGLEGTQDMMPSDLSGGMKKRVALARAFVVEPEVLLYDEPTTGLDPINTRRISDLIRSVQARLGVTSVVVTHDLASAFLVSDRMAMLAGGRIVMVADPSEFRRSSQPAIRDFIGAMALGGTT
jgi:phospholipid/cholesterol/gamma-HCH transport system ATP-binding protein